ncbi:hypothetical protein [Amycolatopsis sp. NPDC004378]
MDGGLLNHLNATVAPPSDLLVIVSCHPLGSPDDVVDSTRDATDIRADAEVAQLRENTRLVAIEPAFSELEPPVNMLDPKIAAQALGIGKRQAEREAAAIRAAWDTSGR